MGGPPAPADSATRSAQGARPECPILGTVSRMANGDQQGDRHSSSAQRLVADQDGGAVHRRYRRAGHEAPQGSRHMGSHRVRGSRRGRRGDLHARREHRGQRGGSLGVAGVRARRDRLRAGGAVLRRVRLHGAGRGQRVHVLLRHVRRVHRLDHRLGPRAGVRRGLGRGGEGLVAVPGPGVRPGGAGREDLVRAGWRPLLRLGAHCCSWWCLRRCSSSGRSCRAG